MTWIDTSPAEVARLHERCNRQAQKITELQAALRDAEARIARADAELSKSDETPAEAAATAPRVCIEGFCISHAVRDCKECRTGAFAPRVDLGRANDFDDKATSPEDAPSGEQTNTQPGGLRDRGQEQGTCARDSAMGSTASARPSEGCTCPEASCPRHPGDEPDPAVWSDCDCATCKAKNMVDTTSTIPKAARVATTRMEGAINVRTVPTGPRSPVADGPIATRFDEEPIHKRAANANAECGRQYGRFYSGDDPGEVTCNDCLAKMAPIADDPIATRFNRTCPMTIEGYLHAAQLAARAHIVPHIRKAAELALEQGRQADFEAFTAIAALVDGAFDPAILKYGEAFLRFVRGAG